MNSTRLSSVTSGSVIGIVSVAGSHPEAVEANRKFRFEEMGFASYAAEYLASTRIDVWNMQHLLDGGCPREVAAAILKGTTWAGDDPRDRYTKTEEDDDGAE